MINAKCKVNGQVISTTGTSGINVTSGSMITITLEKTADVDNWSIVATQADDQIQADGYLVTVNNSKVQNAFTATFVVPVKYSNGRGSALQFTSVTNQNSDTESVYTFGVFVLNNNGSRLFFGGESNESNATVGNAADLNKILFSTGGGTTTNPGGSNTQVQFNDGGVFGGDAGLTFNKSTDVLSVTGGVALGATPAVTGNIRLGNGATIKFRNPSNSADRTILTLDGGDVLRIGDNTGAQVMQYASTWGVYNGSAYDLLVSSGIVAAQSSALTFGATPATAGTIRLTNGGSVYSRNSAGTGDTAMLMQVADETFVGTNSGYSGQTNNVRIYASGYVYLGSGSTTQVGINSSGVNVYSALNLASTLSVGTTPAASGTIRLPNTTSIMFRDAGNTADIAGLTSNGGNIYVGQNNVGAQQATNTSVVATNGVQLVTGSAVGVAVSSSLISLGVPMIGLSTPYGINGVGTQAMADANQTVANTVYCYNTIKTTGAITANRNLVLPTATDVAGYTKIINNTCTGAFSIVVKDGSAGTTVTVANGATVTVLFDSRGATLVGVASASGGSFSAGGDLSGSNTSQSVIKINGASVPASGALVTGNAPYVSGASALTYSALNLAGGSGWVTGILPPANGGTGITSFGSGVQTFLGTPTSTNLAGCLTDETGSGNVVFSTSPTFKTSVLINNPANTFAYTLTPSAITAARTLTIPLLTANDVLVTNDFTQTLTNKTLTSPVITTPNFGSSDLITTGNVTLGGVLTVNGSAITTSSVTTTESGNSKVTIINTIANVSTTNATSTTLYTFTLASNAVTAIDVIVQGIKSDYTAAATYKRAITFRNNGGTVATVGGIVTNDQEDNVAWDCTLTNSTTTVTLAVVGVAATNITWTCQMRRSVTIP